jgi:cathepsin C
MEEIMNNGPIVMSFEPAYDFMYYKSGIYHSVDAADWIKNDESSPEWEKVDHSVLCYGWGESEDGEKYWMLINSWGN